MDPERPRLAGGENEVAMNGEANGPMMRQVGCWGCAFFKLYQPTPHLRNKGYLVVEPTHLKDISQIGSPQPETFNDCIVNLRPPTSERSGDTNG